MSAAHDLRVVSAKPLQMPMDELKRDELLIRLEERSHHISSKMDGLENKLDSTLTSRNFITRAEFEPVKKVVFGMVSLILVAVVGAIVALVVKK